MAKSKIKGKKKDSLGRTHTPKATPKEFKERISRCLKWIDEGLIRPDVIRNGSELWGISTRQVEVYYDTARKIVADQFEREKVTIASDIAKKLDNIYKISLEPRVVSFSDAGDAIEDVDRSNARQALMDKAKIAGLFKREQSTFTNAINIQGQPIPSHQELLMSMGGLMYAEFKRLEAKQKIEGLSSEDVNSLAKLTKTLMDIKEGKEDDAEAKRKRAASMTTEELMQTAKSLIAQAESKEVKSVGEATKDEPNPDQSGK